jgi:integrase
MGTSKSGGTGKGGAGTGWRIRRKPGRTIWTVVFHTPGGRTGERSTGESDDGAARIAAARIFGEEVLADAKGTARARVKPAHAQEQGTELPALFGAWLTALRLTHAPATIVIWELYSVKWIEWFGGIHATERDITREKLGAFFAKRLGEVLATSVKKERAALVNFLAWAESEGYSIVLPVSDLVPRLPKRAAGVAYGKRRRVAAPSLSPEQVRTLIRALPEWSNERGDHERFPVRAKFLVQYETGLRPSLLGRIRTPEHYRKGQTLIRITADIDKAKYARDVPLTRKARRILDYVIDRLNEQGRTGGREYRGPIFGVHDYRKHITRAAKRLPRELAEIFCGAHLRSARITHLLELGANIPGVQQLVGHKQMSTTAKYVKPSFRAAEDALGARRPEKPKPKSRPNKIDPNDDLGE